MGDMIIRIYVTVIFSTYYSQGFKKYFRKCLNWLDALLMILSLFTIILYLKLQDLTQQIEDISFALLIFIRNSSQLLRLVVLLKNEKEVRVILI